MTDVPPAQPHMLTPNGNGFMVHYTDGTTKIAYPAAGDNRYILNTTAGEGVKSAPDPTPDDLSVGVITQGITADMIKASVRSAGGSVSNMVDTPANIAEAFNSAIANTYPNILTTKARAAVLIGECAQESAWWQTTTEYGGPSTAYAPYYGRGYIQLTWKDNYKAFGLWMKSFNLASNEMLYVNNPSAVASLTNAPYTAIFYFSKKFSGNSLWQWCDDVSDPWAEVSRAINRGNPNSPYPAYGESVRAQAIRDVLAVTPDPAAAVGAATGSVAPVDDYPYSRRSWHDVDPWSFYYRECVSFTAWRVRTRTNHKTFVNNWRGAHFGNAYEWDDAARTVGIPTGKTPKVNAIAVRNSGSSGHVAFVNKVYGNGSFDVEEYNHDWTNGVGHVYGKRHVTPKTLGGDAFDNFIYFNEYSAGA